MPQQDKAFAGAIPQLYETYMVPMLFAFYAEDLARRVAALGPADVLETAAGSGAVTRVLARLMPGARIVATDINPPMLARAAELLPPGDALAWQVADAQALPFDDRAFDAVCCQFGIMFFPDRIAACREARRVLRPGGAFLFNTWDSLAENAFAATVNEALAAHFPADPPAFMARIPHGYHDPEAIRADLLAAGFASVEITPLAGTSSAPDAHSVALALCQGTPMRGEILVRDPDGLERATEAAAALLRDRFGPGPLAGPMRALVCEARG